MSLVRRLLFPLLTLLLAVVYAVSIRGMRGSALAYPAIIVGVVLALGLVNLALELRRGFDRSAPRQGDEPAVAASGATPAGRGHEARALTTRLRSAGRPVTLVAALALYAWIMPFLGFYTATLVFLFGTFALLRVPVLRAAITTACCLPVMYLVFTVLFQITTLPRGVLI